MFVMSLLMLKASIMATVIDTSGTIVEGRKEGSLNKGILEVISNSVNGQTVNDTILHTHIPHPSPIVWFIIDCKSVFAANITWTFSVV
jgi:hypothetical protein